MSMRLHNDSKMTANQSGGQAPKTEDGPMRYNNHVIDCDTNVQINKCCGLTSRQRLAKLGFMFSWHLSRQVQLEMAIQKCNWSMQDVQDLVQDRFRKRLCMHTIFDLFCVHVCW